MGVAGGVTCSIRIVDIAHVIDFDTVGRPLVEHHLKYLNIVAKCYGKIYSYVCHGLQ